MYLGLLGKANNNINQLKICLFQLKYLHTANLKKKKRGESAPCFRGTSSSCCFLSVNQSTRQQSLVSRSFQGEGKTLLEAGESLQQPALTATLQDTVTKSNISLFLWYYVNEMWTMCLWERRGGWTTEQLRPTPHSTLSEVLSHKAKWWCSIQIGRFAQSV